MQTDHPDDYASEIIDYDLVIKKLKFASHIFVIGDGGSAAMADHFCCDLLKNCYLPAISLCSNSAIITAIANDYSSNDIFSRQLIVLFQPNDLLVILTGSGNSINLIEALKTVNDRNNIVVSGNMGGNIKKYADVFCDLGSRNQLDCEDRMSRFCHEVTRRIMKINRNTLC